MLQCAKRIVASKHLLWTDISKEAYRASLLQLSTPYHSEGDANENVPAYAAEGVTTSQIKPDALACCLLRFLCWGEIYGSCLTESLLQIVALNGILWGFCNLYFCPN